VDAIHLTARRLLLAVGIVASGSACAGDDDDTLAPLPIEPIAGGTVTPTGGTMPLAATGRPSTTTARRVDAPVGSAASSVPVADWDGARFDVGVIEAVSTSGAYTTIELDRWSYTGPDGGTLDADALDAEPVVGWWQDTPFANVRVQTRMFVLAPDVELLTLDPRGRRAACADPPPADPPVLAWVASGTSGLGSMTTDDIAVLTYSDAGLVTRIRLTRGC